MNFEIHHDGNSLNNGANLRVTMAIKNCEFFEVLLPGEAQKSGKARRPDTWGARWKTLVLDVTGRRISPLVDIRFRQAYV